MDRITDTKFETPIGTVRTAPPEGEPALWVVLKESDARRIVAAAENGRAHEVVEILKQQLWWPEVCAGVRGLRHLRPLDYVEERF